MVLTSSTQWTIPLSTSAVASSPSLTKHGSVLGLKTCQLSPPPLAIASDELHSTSSRRLHGTPDVSNRRSAGSFRQLVSEDFCAKSHDYVFTDIPDWLCGKAYDAPYDGIAMPGSPHLFDAAPNSFNAVNANLVGLHGEITADDVDLLPMPGLLNCPSPFYADSYIPHAHSPRSSKRSTEISSPESSGDSCKSNAMVPDHLGLPPNFNVEEVDHMASVYGGFSNTCQVNAPVTPPADAEHARVGSNHFPFAGGATDNFTDSLAGLWTNSAIECYPDHMHYDSESLASVFNVFPQKFHELSSSGRMDQSHVNTCDNDMAHLVVNELHCLVNPTGEACDEKAKGTHGQPCNAAPHSNASEANSSHPMDTSAMLSESSLGGSMDSASSLEKKCGALGMKRPFSMLQPAGIASSTATSTCMPGTNVWHPQPNSMGLPTLMKEEDATHSFSTMLYKSQKDPKLAGFYDHMAKEQARMDEEMMPKPPPAKMRRKHGTAMDPQSVAARSRREKFSDRIRILQSLVPNGERLDTVSMLGQTLEYVRFLQHQVWQLYHGKDPASLDTCEKWKDFMEAERASANLA